MSMARFSEDEVSALEAGGNEVCVHILPKFTFKSFLDHRLIHFSFF